MACQSSDPTVDIEAVVVGVLQQRILTAIGELRHSQHGRNRCHTHPADGQISNLARAPKSGEDYKDDGKDEKLSQLGRSPLGVTEASTAITVTTKNVMSGSRMGGNSSFWPESISSASDSDSRICESAMENRMQTAEPNAR
jgi:hypothetical protein